MYVMERVHLLEVAVQRESFAWWLVVAGMSGRP